MKNLVAIFLLSPAAVFAQGISEGIVLPQALTQSDVRIGGGACPTPPTVIYDTTRVANQGAEITAVANGPATCKADLIVLDAVSTQRSVCEVEIDVFTLAAVTPFDMTMEFYTACTTDGVAGSACGTGPGTLIPGSTVTVTNITPPAVGTLFSVVFPYPAGVDLSGEADNTISVKVNASRSDVFWRINETPTVGTIPAGEPATSFVERCGSTAANNGCQRNFGVNNNFGMTIRAVEGLPDADLSITKTNGVASSTPGTDTTYTIVASNAGPTPVIGATVADTFPAACSAVSWTCVAAGGATCTAGPTAGNINDLIDLPVGGTATYTAVCSIASAATGTLDNTATIAEPGTVIDPDLSNNSASDSDTLGASADLSITKTAAAVAPVGVGSTVTFTLTASNAGPSDATGVIVTDTLPANVSYVSNTCGASFAAPTVTWNVGTLADGATTNCDVVVTVSDLGTIENGATISATTVDPNPANDSASVTVGGAGALPDSVPVPTLDRLGLLLAGLLLIGLGLVAVRRF